MIYDPAQSPTSPKSMQPPSYESVTSPAGTSRYPELGNGGYSYQTDSKANPDGDKKIVPSNPQPFYRQGTGGGESLYPEPTTLYPSNTGQPPQSYPYHTPATPIGGQPPTVYYYRNPKNGHTISSLLPPDHPEMICLQEGRHVQKTKYGVVGILVGIFWFPLGLAVTLLDRKVRCKRCGLVLHNGLLDM